MLRILHTADWHLGKKFPAFPEEAQKKLSRARMEVVPRILDLGRRNNVDAILCAGDLFDDSSPGEDFWDALAKTFRDHPGPHVPIFLVPGNHDPLTTESVWAAGHPFRGVAAGMGARRRSRRFLVRLVARRRPVCPSVPVEIRRPGSGARAAGARARRSTGAHRLRPRLHVRHRGLPNQFPNLRDAGVVRGLDYLAIGDTHSFRDVTANLPVPTVYPGAPEPTNFDEPDAGFVALVALFRHGMRPRVQSERVAFWRWLDVPCREMHQLRALLTTPDLERHVVRLRLDMTVSLSEEHEVERIVRELQGTDAAHGRAGVLLVDRKNLRLRP